MNIALRVGVLFCGALTFAAENPWPAPLETARARSGVPRDAVALWVQEVGSEGGPRLAYRSDVLMQPASVMKLVTTVAALDLLGPAYTWGTPVYLSGEVRDGTLHGDLILQGQGDPKLVLERLWLLLRRVRAFGVQRIAGDIVLDSSAFAPYNEDPSRFDGEPLRPYNAGPSALLVNYKALTLTLTPDPAHQRADLLWEPNLEGVQLPSQVPLSATPCDDFRAALKVDFTDPLRVRFRGAYPAACGERSWSVAYADPAGFAARAIAAAWREAGGTLGGKVRDGRVDAALAPRFVFESPPLAEVVRDINKFSNNVMAQQLFLTLSLPQASFAASRARVGQWWTQRLGADAPQVDNGAGLSREDRISAHALGRLLQWSWRSAWMPELLASLPNSGVDGTLRRNHAGVNAHLKTGSLRDVQAIAGYVPASSGRRYVVVVLVNHAQAHAARPFLDAVLRWVADDVAVRVGIP